MSIEQSGMPLPEYNWGDHATWFATTQQFNQLNRNLQKEGMTEWLGHQAIGSTEAWDGFTAITDQLADAEVLEVVDETNPSTTVRIEFESSGGRDVFARFVHKSLAGIPTRANPPFIEVQGSRTPRLIIEDLTYPDLSKLGQIGTATCMAANKGSQALRILQELPAGLLDPNDAAIDLKDKTKARITYQRLAVGEDTFVTSGHLAILGREMRKYLAPRAEDLAKMSRRQARRASLQVQRPFGQRTTLDEYANFLPTSVAKPTDAPFSTIGVGQLMGRQLGERVHEVKKSIQDRRPQSVEQLGDLITGLGLNQSISVAIRALYTLTTASGWATWQVVRDRFKK